MATDNLRLSKDTRLFIGNAANAADTDDFVLVENENNLVLSYEAEDNNIVTKSAGRKSLPGTESYEIQFDTNELLSDAAEAHLLSAKNKSWPYEIRHGSTLWIKGNFVLRTKSVTSPSEGAREGSYTLNSDGVIVENALSVPSNPST